MNTTILDLKKELGNLNAELISREAVRSMLIKNKEDLEQQIANLEIEVIEQCNVVLHKLADNQREAACRKLEELCTYALQYAISPNYRMKIELRTLRNKPAADIYIIKNDTGVVSSPLESSGGGIVDIVSTALRFITMEVWQNPVIDGPVILDEAYKHVSREYIPLVSSFLKKLVHDFERQILLCTHNEFLSQVADRQIVVTMENGISIVKTVEIKE